MIIGLSIISRGDIQEKLSDKQKQQAVEAYFNFKNDGIVFGDHAIARYIERNEAQ